MLVQYLLQTFELYQNEFFDLNLERSLEFKKQFEFEFGPENQTTTERRDSSVAETLFSASAELFLCFMDLGSTKFVTSNLTLQCLLP